MIRAVLRSSDNVVQVTGVKDVLTGEFINSASVWASVFDASMENVDGVSWPITLEYVEGSDGDYVGSIPDSADLKVGNFYTIRVSVDDGPGRKIVEDYELEIVKRQK